MMDAGALIESYGYWALAAGCFLEGETILALAGFSAHQGHLDLFWVVMVATVAASAGDQCCFWLGRRHGDQFLARYPSLAAKMARVHALMLRYDSWLIVGLRFAYGLRLVGPLLIGMTTVRASRFVLFNVLGAVVWAMIVASLGWLFGHVVESMLGQMQRLEGAALAALLATGLLVWSVRRSRHRRQDQ